MKKSTKSEKPAAPQDKPVAKKTVERKPVKKAVAPRKIPTPKAVAPSIAAAPPSAPAPAARVVTTLVANINVGFGNQLFVRGEGPGLSWDEGTPMVCLAGDQWTLAIDGASRPVMFKFLINDRRWSAGADYSAAPGATVVLTPTFE